MKFKKLGVALLATLALSAVIASASQAAMWNSSTIGTWGSGQSGTASAVNTTTGTLTSKVLGSPFKITSSKLSSEEGKLTQTASAAQLTGKLIFGGLTVVEPSGCKTTETIKTTSLVGTAQMGNTEATKEFVYVKLAPASGEVFATITLSGCAAAGSYQAKGTDYVKAANATGVAATSQEGTTSGEINASQGGELKLGPEKATLEGSLKVSLASGESFSLQP